MTKLELVERVARKCHLTKKGAEQVLEALLLEIGTEAARGPVRLPRFGTFRPTSRKARRIRNPVTKELMRLPKLRAVGFRPAEELKAKAARALGRAG